ncbi:MAG: DNA primase [Firmicutes bacterium]|nr:DNA primase [Bacillota bacterium]
MAQRTSGVTAEELKDQLNIVDVISRVIPLKRAGSNYKGICPFHNEKTPSFIVSEQKQIFTCFGCGASGDVIEFTKRYYNLDFMEACEKLGRENGIEVGFRKGTENKKRDRLLSLNRTAARYFCKTFFEAKNPGYTYMRSRGMDDATLTKFGVGYADPEWDSLTNYMKSKGASDDELIELGLSSRSRDGRLFDKFRNRVMFPIINTTGNVIGFGGRKIDEKDEPKYLNSPENLVFRKKNNLYGLNTAKQEVGDGRPAIIVEGYMDVMGLYRYGVKNAVASLGTALTENQAKLIKRYTRDVVLCYDADTAGRNAALRGIEVLSAQELKVRVFHVEDGKDPDEYVKAHGKDRFLDLAGQAPPATQYKLENAAIGLELSNEEGKLEYLRRAAAILKGLSPVERDIYVKSLAERLKVSERAINEEIELNRTASVRQERPRTEYDEESVTNLTSSDAYIIKALITDPSLTEKLFEEPAIIASSLGRKIEENLFRTYGLKGTYEEADAFTDLEPDEVLKASEALKAVALNGKEEEVFMESMRRWKLRNLRKQQSLIIDKIEIAENSEMDQDTTEELTRELIDVELKIKELEERNHGRN